MARADMISIVEAAYDLGSDEKAWLQNLVDTFQSVHHFDFGILAYRLNIDDSGVHVRDAVESRDSELNLVERINSMAKLMGRPKGERGGVFSRATVNLFERMMRQSYRQSVGKLAYSEYQRIGPRWMSTLGTPAKDVFVMGNHNIDRLSGIPLLGGLKREARFSRGQREQYARLSSHIKAAERLRQRLGRAREELILPDDGAVLDSAGRVLDADGAAKQSDAIGALKARTKDVERARAKGTRSKEEALSLWQALVRGEWSLVEQFDSDGKRFILAHRNPEQVKDPRGLSDIECRVAGLAVRGYSDALIGYHLGLPVGTVSSHLSSVMRKLGVASRVELVRLLGVYYPLEMN